MLLQNHAGNSRTGAMKLLITTHGEVGQRGETFPAVPGTTGQPETEAAMKSGLSLV